MTSYYSQYIDGLVQDCCISSANALEILQSYTEPSICHIAHLVGQNMGYHFDGFVQQRRNSSALAMELRLSCTNPSICEFQI